jgi:hypothetical protein
MRQLSRFIFETLNSLFLRWISPAKSCPKGPQTMPRSMMGAGLTVPLVLAYSPWGLAAEVVAKKDGVEIFAESTNKSEVLGTLKKGESLESVERKGMFWQVKVKESKIGYVSILAVKHNADANPGLVKAINGAVRGDRALDDSSESRARSAVMGVRGLRADDDMAQASQVRPNLRAVFEMEDVRVSQKKIGELGDKVMGEIARKAEK